MGDGRPLRPPRAFPPPPRAPVGFSKLIDRLSILSSTKQGFRTEAKLLCADGGAELEAASILDTPNTPLATPRFARNLLRPGFFFICEVVISKSARGDHLRL